MEQAGQGYTCAFCPHALVVLCVRVLFSVLRIKLAQTVEIIPSVLSKSAGQGKSNVPPACVVSCDVYPLAFYRLSQAFHIIEFVAAVALFGRALLLCRHGLRCFAKVGIGIMWKETRPSYVLALLVGSDAISLSAVIKQTLKILLMLCCV